MAYLCCIKLKTYKVQTGNKNIKELHTDNLRLFLSNKFIKEWKIYHQRDLGMNDSRFLQMHECVCVCENILFIF